MHSLSLSLARHSGLVACARHLVRARATRLARIAAIFVFVQRIAAAEAVRRARLHERYDGDLSLGDLAAAVLSAMLRAAGERATVAYTREMAFVRVAVTSRDVARLPPWARVLASPAGGLELALAPRGRWLPAGYLPPAVTAALQRRRPSMPIAC